MTTKFKKIVADMVKKQTGRTQYEVLTLNLETGMTETIITDRDGILWLTMTGVEILETAEIA